MKTSELLELAAKAAGIHIVPCTCGNPRWPFKHEEAKSGKRGHWNPLEDDGDALRLAARLEIDVWHGKWPSGEKYVAAHKVWCRNDSRYYDDGVAHKNDKEEATRRAIVRAAAEIGKELK